MATARAPWWVPAIAASVLAYLALMIYAEVFGPGALGVGLRFRQGRVLVVEVVDRSPAAVAGLVPGDEIAAVNFARAFSANPPDRPATALALAEALAGLFAQAAHGFQ